MGNRVGLGRGVIGGSGEVRGRLKLARGRHF
jgi:hypothetical protein